MSHPSDFEDINTEVTGFSYYTAEIPEPRLDALEAPEDGKIHILLGHGGDANHVPIDRAALASSGFSYIALGHIHRPEILLDKKMAYCGSPEPLDKTGDRQARHPLRRDRPGKLSGNDTGLYSDGEAPLHPAHRPRHAGYDQHGAVLKNRP